MAAKYFYFKAKDQKSTGAVFVDRVCYNNVTVTRYAKGNVPTSVQLAVKNHQLADATEAEYNAYMQMQEDAEAHAQKVKEERKAAAKRRKKAKLGEPIAEEVEAPKKEVEVPKKEVEAPKDEVSVSAAAQKMIDENGLDVADIKGTGKGGNITKGDVEDYLAANAPKED